MAITYRNDILTYALGRRANMEEWNTVTRTAEAVIKFGVPVTGGTNNHTCKVVSGAAQNVIGIAEASMTLPASAAAPADQYEAGDNVAVCEFGVIGVLLGGSVTVGNPARYNKSSGKWVDDTASSDKLVIPGAEFAETGGADGAIGIVRYRRPVPSKTATS